MSKDLRAISMIFRHAKEAARARALGAGPGQGPWPPLLHFLKIMAGPEIFGYMDTTINSVFLVGREHGSRGSMFRTCSEHRVPNMFRTSRIAISSQNCLYRMPPRPQIWEILHFQELFTLLVFEKSNSQNRHICNFHASKNPDTDNPWSSGSMFRTCSEHLVRNSVLGQLRV